MKSHYLHVGNNHLGPYLQSTELFKVDFSSVAVGVQHYQWIVILVSYFCSNVESIHIEQTIVLIVLLYIVWIN